MRVRPCVLDTHGAYVKEMSDIEALREIAGGLAQLCGLDVLAGGVMIEDDSDFVLIEDAGEAGLVEFDDGDGGGDVIAQHQIELGFDQITGLDGFKSRMGSKDFLGHGHSHGNASLLSDGGRIIRLHGSLRWPPAAC